MSYGNIDLLPSIRELQQAVYYEDIKQRTRSLPHDNSVRIDLLTNKIDTLESMVENATSGNLPVYVNKIVKYLDGSDDVGYFPQTMYGNDIIQVGNSDKNNYTNVRSALQQLYNREQASTSSGIEYNSNKDIYSKYMVETLPTDYKNNIKKYPALFPYFYEEINYLAENLFERETNFNIYSGMNAN